MIRLARSSPVPPPPRTRRRPSPPRMSEMSRSSAPASAVMKPIPIQAGSSGELVEVLARVDPLGAAAHHDVARQADEQERHHADPQRPDIAARDDHARGRREQAADEDHRAEDVDEERQVQAVGTQHRGKHQAPGFQIMSTRISRIASDATEWSIRPCCVRAELGELRVGAVSARPRRAPSRGRWHASKIGAAAAPRLGPDRPEDDRCDHPAAPDGDAVERDREPDAEDDRPERRRPSTATVGDREETAGRDHLLGKIGAPDRRRSRPRTRSWPRRARTRSAGGERAASRSAPWPDDIERGRTISSGHDLAPRGPAIACFRDQRSPRDSSALGHDLGRRHDRARLRRRARRSASSRARRARPRCARSAGAGVRSAGARWASRSSRACG